ncbi:hypothetical protein ACXR2U_08505 [Jatrophihabitans sp. YIM 134969]
MIRRLLAVMCALTSLAVGVVLFSPAASADPYPPTNPPSLAASAYDPCAGASNALSGNGFRAGEAVRVVLIGRGELGRPVADANGSWRLTVLIPANARGAEVITATGLTSGLSASVGLDVPCVLGQSSTSVDDGGGLAYTGVAVGGVLLAAAVLLGVGGMLLVAGRRRRAGATLS